MKLKSNIKAKAYAGEKAQRNLSVGSIKRRWEEERSEKQKGV